MDISVLDVVLRLFLGGVIGFCIGLSGIGGGVLVLPSLTLILGLPASAAVGTANLYAFLTKANASYHHVRLKTIDYSTTLLFLAGAIPADIIVSAGINRYVAHVQDNPAAWSAFQEGLRIFIVGTVLACVVLLVINLFRRKPAAGSSSCMERFTAKVPGGRETLAVLLGVVVGGLIGSTSIGGGVLIVPMLILVFGLSPSRTVGTSIGIAVVLTLLSAIVYGTSGQLDVVTALIMAVGSLLGVPAGSKLSVKLPARLLQGIVIAIILVAAAMMAFQQGH